LQSVEIVVVQTLERYRFHFTLAQVLTT